MKIYVILHKDIELPKQIEASEEYVPLLVGACDKELPLKKKYTCDDTGENISTKNKLYCELTGLYWMWKNSKENIIGLVHYRRYFAKIHRIITFEQAYYCTNVTNAFCILKENDFNDLLNNHDLIVKKSKKWIRGNKPVFTDVIGNRIWCVMDNVIKSQYPDYYSYFKTYEKKNYHVNANMFVGKKDIISKYCEWLFDILQGIEDNYQKDYNESLHNRELGYLGEFLFGIWLDVNSINYVFADVVMTENTGAKEDTVRSITQFIPDVIEYISRNIKKYVFRKH